MSDRLYELIHSWSEFDKDTVGKQLVRAADSIGANIAESYGRFHYGEKINFLYFARGSIYETKFWIRRIKERQLWPAENCEKTLNYLDEFAKKLNAYIRDKRDQRSNSPKKISESPTDYTSDDFTSTTADDQLGD
jgi:four helix bundle protein